MVTVYAVRSLARSLVVVALSLLPFSDPNRSLASSLLIPILYAASESTKYVTPSGIEIYETKFMENEKKRARQKSLE